MPDFERLCRELELHVTKDPIKQAKIQGRHEGLDKARWEIVGLLVIVLVLVASLICATIN